MLLDTRGERMAKKGRKEKKRRWLMAGFCWVVLRALLLFGRKDCLRVS